VPASTAVQIPTQPVSLADGAGGFHQLADAGRQRAPSHDGGDLRDAGATELAEPAPEAIALGAVADLGRPGIARLDKA